MVTAGLKALRKAYAKRMVCFVTMLTAVVAVLAISTVAQIKTVTINVDGKKTTVKTYAKTVESVLLQHGISLGEHDEINPPLESDTSKNMTITLHKAFAVPFVLGTDKFEITTSSKTLKEVLSAEGIILGEYDIVNPSLDTVLTKGSSVYITRVFKGDVTKTEVIPYKKKYVPNNEMERGKSKVVTSGENGTKELVYNTTVSNGEETERTFVGERIVKEPVQEVIQYGTKSINPISRGSMALTSSDLSGYSYVDCKATSYDLSGRTATGMAVQRGVIAVDPRVIPLGTRVYVQSLDGRGDYGYAIAADTGGRIKGNKIDLWVPSRAEAMSNGVKRVRVYILN
ncbi:MAG: ubiquitin-like domain-containing protein [Bacillota bacterium]|nr:ubiquitin-like domain-containing protein [Bacillota bacterium]